jgi:soluble lytic murein transglycosylase
VSLAKPGPVKPGVATSGNAKGKTVPPAKGSANAAPMPLQTAPSAAPPPANAALSHAAPAPPRVRTPAAQGAPLATASTSQTSQADIETLQQIVALTRKKSAGAATEAASALQDPLARKLAEWLILRSEDNGARTERYAAFLAANPSWPSLGLLRRRAEAALWDDKRDSGAILTYFNRETPLSAKGHFAAARAWLERGDRNRAAQLVRTAWRSEKFSEELERVVLDEFGALLSAGDHKTRADIFLMQDDSTGGLRNAQRVGGATLVIAKAHAAVIKRAVNAKALLDGVPAQAHHDPTYLFSRAQWARRHDHTDEAARYMAQAPSDPAKLVNTNEWWIERRVLVRQLLDAGDPRMAYRIAANAAPAEKRSFRSDKEFTAGWIALRFLNDPNNALTHFTRLEAGTDNPTALGRAGYWQGRALEALGRSQEARAAYASAAEHTTAYYGQLARARIGIKTLVLHNPPQGHGAQAANLEVVRALELLYAIGEKDMTVPMLAELGDRAGSEAIAALAEVAVRNKDARGLLLLAKDAINRGLPFDNHAYPTFGMPKVTQIGPDIDPAVVYAIARQESGFNPRVVSPANAMGLMQVTPAAGKYVAKKFGVAYDGARLLSDQTYNVQIGSAELADLIRDYRGSYIMAFAGYNAGRGRVKTWVGRYGDPRDASVDAVDWVERIPFAETRNYVQRILENMQVYRARFGGGSQLRIEADLHGGRGAGGQAAGNEASGNEARETE